MNQCNARACFGPANGSKSSDVWRWSAHANTRYRIGAPLGSRKVSNVSADYLCAQLELEKHGPPWTALVTPKTPDSGPVLACVVGVDDVCLFANAGRQLALHDPHEEAAESKKSTKNDQQ